MTWECSRDGTGSVSFHILGSVQRELLNFFSCRSLRRVGSAGIGLLTFFYYCVSFLVSIFLFSLQRSIILS